MKYFFAMLLVLPFTLMAQKKHTVSAKETFYSIGRMYNVKPGVLAAFNHISLEKGVKVGQVLLIPEQNTDAISEGVKSLDTASSKMAKKLDKPVEILKNNLPDDSSATHPVYHNVRKGESLSAISKKYKGVSVAKIKQWNSLLKDGVKEGSKIIVGFVKTDLSGELKKDANSLLNKINQSNVIDSLKRMISKTESTTVVNIKSKDSVSNAATKYETKKSASVKEGGYFGSLFVVQRTDVHFSTQSGLASVFKSNSGWDDGKYYCLTGIAPAGSVIKISNPKNQKFVYAKVLDVIPAEQSVGGTSICVSNSAAYMLGAEGDKFQVVLYHH